YQWGMRKIPTDRSFTLLFRSEKEVIRARIYEGEDVISFSKNPALVFGKDLEKLKEYLNEKYGMKKLSFLHKEGSSYINL
ncbi:hypothetical protein, partial [Metabacillus fastidiosus]|uniref:hypothetical protein n=1 Tax=Metabacillus fastidiosus TaxID=1458 RepID=UPI003D2D944D